MNLFRLAIVLTLLVLCVEVERALPQTISAKSVAAHSISLKWVAPKTSKTIPKPTAYNIYRTQNNGTWVRISQVGPQFRIYTDKNTVSGQTYQYEVKAVNNTTEGQPTNIAAATAK